MKNHDLIRKVMSKRKKWRSHEVYFKLIKLRESLGLDIISQSNMERRFREMNDVKCKKSRKEVKGKMKTVYYYMLEVV